MKLWTGNFVSNASSEEDGEDEVPPEGTPNSQGAKETNPRKGQKMSIPTAGTTKDWFASEHMICDIIETCRKKWAARTATGFPYLLHKAYPWLKLPCHTQWVVFIQGARFVKRFPPAQGYLGTAFDGKVQRAPSHVHRPQTQAFGL